MGFISILLILGSLTIGTMILGEPLRADRCGDNCGAGTTCCCGSILPKAGGVGDSCVRPLSVFETLGIELINNCACVDDNDINTCESNEECSEGQKCCCDGGQPRPLGSDPCSQAPARVPELGIIEEPRACSCVDVGVRECTEDSDCPMPQLCCCENRGHYNRYPELEDVCPEDWTSPQAPPKYLAKSDNCQCMDSQQLRISNGTRY